MKTGEFFYAVRSGDLELTGGGRQIQMLYRVGADLKLLQGGKGKRGGHIMGIDTGGGAPVGDVSYFCKQVMTQVEEYGYKGVCCFFRGGRSASLVELVEALSQSCKRRGLLLIVTEEYGEVENYGKVLISTALSGGCLEGRFRTAMEKYGRQRVMMDIDCMGEDFLLPAPKGTGERMSLGEIETRRREKQAEVFFSQELCARYFTYQNKEHSLRFVLYDDEGTVREKIRLGKLWKIYGIVGTFEELRYWDIL